MLIHIVYNHLARAAGKLFRCVCRSGTSTRGSSRSALENVKKGGAWVSCFSQGVPRSDRFWKRAWVRAQLWNRILARFRPPHTPSAEHAPTPAHPRTPAHLLDINNPDCYLVKKKSPGPFFLYIERSPSPRLPVSPSPRLTYLVS